MLIFAAEVAVNPDAALLSRRFAVPTLLPF
jgi:hypothetical protein